MLRHAKPQRAAELMELARRDLAKRWSMYEYLAGREAPPPPPREVPPSSIAYPAARAHAEKER
jgi:hypothetical protein